MISTQHNIIISFLKATFLTAVMVGSLVAQSYATTALFSDTTMKMNIEFSATDGEESVKQVASMTVNNEQMSSLEFGDHRINIKTTFIKWAEDAAEPEQIFAELKLLKLAKNGSIEFSHSPSFMVDKDQWAEFRIAPTEDQEGIEVKMKYEDFFPIEDDKVMNDQPIWLNWGDKEFMTEVC